MICNMNQRLVWVKVSRNQFQNKRFSHHPLGMQEPMATRGQHVSHLDLLLMPLLACDPYGTRIGMGGGFYDKTLASAPITVHFVWFGSSLPVGATALDSRNMGSTFRWTADPSTAFTLQALKLTFLTVENT
jgi:5-formyltetrahydrofolate cyclo-ligase